MLCVRLEQRRMPDAQRQDQKSVPRSSCPQKYSIHDERQIVRLVRRFLKWLISYIEASPLLISSQTAFPT